MSDDTDPKTEQAEGRRNYHHGALRDALLEAALALLEETGAEPTLRRVAARAGVSHAAPAHHFKDRDGLMDALAALGYARLTASMRDARAGLDGRARLRAIGQGYVAFAVAEPALFSLTFSRPPARYTDGGPLVGAARQAYGELEAGVRAAHPGRSGADLDHAATAHWSLVHGFSTLEIANQLKPSGESGPASDRLRAAFDVLDL